MKIDPKSDVLQETESGANANNPTTYTGYTASNAAGIQYTEFLRISLSKADSARQLPVQLQQC